MTAKTQAALLTEARDRLDEPVERMWTDVQLRKWINDGCRDIARKGEVCQKSTTVATTGGTQEYTLGSDIIRIYRVEWTASGDSNVYPVEFRDYNNMDSVWGLTKTLAASYHPYIFTLFGYSPALKIILYPTPAGDGTLKIYYYGMPALLLTDGTDASDSVDIPEGWEDLVVDYVEYMALRKDGDPRWQEAKAKYDENLMAIIEAANRWSDAAGMMVPQSGVGMVPSWLYGGDF